MLLRGARPFALLAFLSGCSPLEPFLSPPAADACAAYAFSDQAALRVFSVQPRISPEHFESYDAYRRHLEGLVEEHITPCLARDRQNLIVFPENMGLEAAFIGTRGKEARSKTDATSAFFALVEPYQPATNFYRQSWPDLALAEGVFLGATDTLCRAFSETMSDIARNTGAYVIASSNVSASIEKSSDIKLVESLRDPDLPDASYVYVAHDRHVYNTAFVFDPSGKVVAETRKPYLVPAEELDLLFSRGPLIDVAPFDTGAATIGILTSKDAWMPDVVDRLEAMGATVFIQPEAFSGWAVEELPGDWLPDVFQQSAWAATQKHGGYRYAVVSHLTGNLFDQVFDGQSAILGDASPGSVYQAYIGQDPQGGFLSVSPWAINDPGVDDPSLSLDARRSVLRERGMSLLPGGANENAYIETVVAADIDPRSPFPKIPDGVPGTFGKSQELAPSPQGQERRPALAADGGGGVYAVFEDDRDGVSQIYFARSLDGGASFDPAFALAPSQGAELMPAVVATASSIYVAFREQASKGGRILVTRSGDGGASFSVPVPIYPGAQDPPDEWWPAMAAANGRVHVAFVGSEGGNERILVASAQDGALSFDVVAGDGAKAGYAPGNPRNNQWAPAIAADAQEVFVSWVDFRNFNWDVFLSRSMDGGASFADAWRIDDGTEVFERINDDTVLALTKAGIVAGWSDVRLRQAPAKARAMWSASGSLFGESRVLGDAPPTSSSYRPRFAVLEGGELLAAWQDQRSLGSDIYVAMSADGGKSFSAELRLDDGGEGQSLQFAPALAASGGRAVVAWEDTRSGRRQIRYLLVTLSAG